MVTQLRIKCETNASELAEGSLEKAKLRSDISKQEANLAQCAVDRAELERALEDEKSKVSRAELTIAQMSSERDFEMAHKAQLEVAL